MAIYHCRLRTFSRSHGHSAVAAAAYRAGEILRDERTNQIHRYEKRSGVLSAFILAPNSAPKKFQDRACLWNAAEHAENRKNSRVAREVILALPHELSEEQRTALTTDVASWLIERYRVAVDVAIHSPVKGDGHDPRNHHAHLLFTTRELTKDGLGSKTRVLDDKVTGPEEVEVIREVWEALANDALKKAGFSDIQIDRRTLEDQGIDRIPQTHVGQHAWQASKEESEDQGEGEEESSGEKSASSSSSGGGASVPFKEDSESEEEQGGASDDGGAALKIQSKPKLDDDGRIINYPAIDRKQTRSKFVAEIKQLNERRAAFDEKPLKEQIKDLDTMMERLDGRVKHLEELQHKTSLPQRLIVSVKDAARTAARLFTARKVARSEIRLSAKENTVRKERQQKRYGRSYRRGLHAQIREMKSNIQTLERKQIEYKNYRVFVTKLEKEIADHTPSIANRGKEARSFDQASKKPVKTSTRESKLKLHLKASVMRENLPLTYQRAQAPQERRFDLRPVERLTPLAKQSFKQPKLEIEAPKQTVIDKPNVQPQKTVSKLATNAPPQKLKVPNVKLSSNIRIKEYYMKNYPPPVKEAVYRKVLKTHIPAIQKEMEKRGPYSVPTGIEIKLARSVGMKTLKGVNIDKPPPKNVKTRDAVQDLKTRSEELRESIPSKYRAQSGKESDYLNETPKPEASSLKKHHAEKAQTKRPSKMTGAFNQDLKQQGGKRGIDVDKGKIEKGSDIERIDPESDLE